MLPSQTVNVSIACSPTKAYDFIRDPYNLPQWANGLCIAVRPAGGNDASGADWIADTPHGPVGLSFVAPNDLGVLDHYVSPAPGVQIYVPLRVLPNQEGCEVLFTLFRQPGMTDQHFATDANMVRRDLNALKQILEA